MAQGRTGFFKSKVEQGDGSKGVVLASEQNVPHRVMFSMFCHPELRGLPARANFDVRQMVVPHPEPQRLELRSSALGLQLEPRAFSVAAIVNAALQKLNRSLDDWKAQPLLMPIGARLGAWKIGGTLNLRRPPELRQLDDEAADYGTWEKKRIAELRGLGKSMRASYDG